MKLPKSFVAVNLSDAFSWPKQQSEDDSEEGGLMMKSIEAAKSGETSMNRPSTAAQDLVKAISEAADAAEQDVAAGVDSVPIDETEA